MKIHYVTGNKGKVELINLIFKDFDVEIIQENMETPEIQCSDCKEIAKFSAEYAANFLKKPVLKNDSGLVIEALNGFPGAFAKYVEQMLGAKGFIKLMNGEENRRCYWVEALAYCEPNKEPVVFESLSYGRIAETTRGTRGEPYDKIFIPDGSDLTFAEMTLEEQLNTFDKKAYMELLQYLLKNK